MERINKNSPFLELRSSVIDQHVARYSLSRRQGDLWNQFDVYIYAVSSVSSVARLSNETTRASS